MIKMIIKLLIPTLSLIMISQSQLYGQNKVLKAGISKVDIPSSESLYMGGYDESCRVGPSQGNQGNIFVRTLVFDDQIKRVAFVELDVVSLPRDNYDTIRKQISDVTGLPIPNIILGCVHNHSAPYPGGKNINSDWYKQFNESIIKSVQEAILNLEPVKIGGGLGRSYIAMNRRKIMDDTLSYLTFDENNSSQSYGKYMTDHPVLIREMEGVCRLGANPGGSTDDDVGILRIDRMDGQLKAVFVNYACHGTSLGGRNNFITPEWNGYMLEYIEEQFPGVIAIFAPGAAGDINPRFVGGLEGYMDNIENTKVLGCEIGREVVNIIPKIKTDIPLDHEIKLAGQNIMCPKKYGEVVKDFRNTTITIPITAIRIDDFTWVTFPGELFHEIGLTIKASMRSSNTYIVGYSNGSVGYLPTQKAYSEGGYEPWAAKFAPVSEKIFVADIQQMLIRLY